VHRVAAKQILDGHFSDAVQVDDPTRIVGFRDNLGGNTMTFAKLKHFANLTARKVRGGTQHLLGPRLFENLTHSGDGSQHGNTVDSIPQFGRIVVQKAQR